MQKLMRESFARPLAMLLLIAATCDAGSSPGSLGTVVALSARQMSSKSVIVKRLSLSVPQEMASGRECTNFKRISSLPQFTTPALISPQDDKLYISVSFGRSLQETNSTTVTNELVSVSQITLNGANLKFQAVPKPSSSSFSAPENQGARITQDIELLVSKSQEEDSLFNAAVTNCYTDACLLSVATTDGQLSCALVKIHTQKQLHRTSKIQNLHRRSPSPSPMHEAENPVLESSKSSANQESLASLEIFQQTASENAPTRSSKIGRKDTLTLEEDQSLGVSTIKSSELAGIREELISIKTQIKKLVELSVLKCSMSGNN